MVIVEMNGQIIRLGSLHDQIYSLEHESGWSYHWNASEGMRVAKRRGGLTFFVPADFDLTAEDVFRFYPELDAAYALTTDLSRPILFVTLEGNMQLIDGWHRLYRAVVQGVSRLPAYVLSKEESDSVLIVRLPPGIGLDGSRSSASQGGNRAQGDSASGDGATIGETSGTQHEEGGHP